MKSFTELKVWQRSHQLVLRVYRASTAFPSDEKFELTSQLRRAAVSVPANIAEGSKRPRGADSSRLHTIAAASLAETQYLLLLCRDLGYLSDAADLINEADEIAAMLHNLRSRQGVAA